MSTEVTKPKEERVLKIRGTGKIDVLEHTFEFTPQGTGQPAQRDVKKYGNAKAYTTTGKEPKRVVTLQCAENATDPYGELDAQRSSSTATTSPARTESPSCSSSSGRPGRR